MKCNACQKEGVYIRLKRKEIVCRQCGHIEKQTENKEKK